MESYALLALIIIAFWVVGYIVYIVISNRQTDLQSEIKHIDTFLEESETEVVAE